MAGESMNRRCDGAGVAPLMVIPSLRTTVEACVSETSAELFEVPSLVVFTNDRPRDRRGSISSRRALVSLTFVSRTPEEIVTGTRTSHLTNVRLRDARSDSLTT